MYIKKEEKDFTNILTDLPLLIQKKVKERKKKRKKTTLQNNKKSCNHYTGNTEYTAIIYI